MDAGEQNEWATFVAVNLSDDQLSSAQKSIPHDLPSYFMHEQKDALVISRITCDTCLV